MEQKEEFEIEKIINVNIIKDSKQTRITIPAEIVEDFRIRPERYQFAWIIQKAKNSNTVTINGQFVIKQNKDKNEEEKE